MVPLEWPVLSLALDAVVKVDGEDALCGLLTLFSKCRGSLQDGDRLENMAWRLWHVGRSSSHLVFPTPSALSSPDLVASLLTSSSSSSSEGDSDVSSDGETWDQDQATTIHEDTGGPNGLSPALSTSLFPLDAPHGRHPHKRRKTRRRSPSTASTGSRTLSPSRRPSLSSRRTHSNTSVGQIMADLLPEKLDLYGAKRVQSHGTLNERDGRWRYNSGEVPAVIVMSDVRSRPSSPQLSPQPDRSIGFPTVVIVNPTPHPTPPMTPQFSPASPPNGAVVGQMSKRDTLSVVTRLPSTPSTSSLPPTPESMQEKTVVEDLPPHTINLSQMTLHPPASGPRNNTNSNARSSVASADMGMGMGMPPHPIGSTGAGISNHITEKSSTANGPVNKGPRLSAGATSANGASLNPSERKFFIVQTGSPDGDSPDTSASSQVGSQSALCLNVATSSSCDVRVAAATANAVCEPASVASRASVNTARSHSSNGSSSRGGLRMKFRKGTAAAKGKGREVRHGQMQRMLSSGRVHLQLGGAGLTGGTIQRSKLGGRTAAAAASNAAAAASHFGQLNARAQHAATRPPPTVPLRSEVQPEKQVTGSSASGRMKTKSPQSGSTKRRSMTSLATSKSGSSKAAGAKTNGKALPTSSAKQRRIELAEDSDFSTDEWDTEDGSEYAERTSGEHEKTAAPAATDRKLVEAAAEAQRQRDLFAKVDRRSYTNLNRTQSGLLTSIFHPDPSLFPVDHPYRHSRSTQDILANTHRPVYQALPLQPTKSIAAGPVAANVTAQGVGSPNNGRRRSPLRLKGRPEDVEESDSGDDDEENKVQVSASVAEQRLAALHKGKRPGQPSELSQQWPAPQRQNTMPAVPQVQESRYGAPEARSSPLARVATAPIPLGYPYNLPPPMPPSTPRTTRRNMLTHELSESLRRNLLWERQVSKQRPMGLGRRVVTNAAPQNQGVLGNPLRPLTTLNNVMTAAAPAAPANGSGGGSGKDSQLGAPAANVAPASGSAEDVRRQKALARNRSWADNYHAAGW